MYVLDTGIRATHQEFRLPGGGWRVQQGFSGVMLHGCPPRVLASCQVAQLAAGQRCNGNMSYLSNLTLAAAWQHSLR